MFVKKIRICRFLPKKGQAFIFKHSNLQVCFDFEENKKLYSFGLIYKIRLKSNKQINLIFFLGNHHVHGGPITVEEASHSTRLLDSFFGFIDKIRLKSNT